MLKLTLRTSVEFRNLSAEVTWYILLFSGIQNINTYLTKLLVEDVDVRNQISEIHRMKGDTSYLQIVKMLGNSG